MEDDSPGFSPPPLPEAEARRAIDEGNVDALRRLLEEGLWDVNWADERGKTALHHACSTGRIDMARLCLDYGAEVDSVNEIGHTPFCAACYGDHVDLARLCADRGADVHHAPTEHFTAMQWACLRGSSSIVNLCLECGVDVNELSNIPRGPGQRFGYFTALSWAVFNSRMEVVRLLVSHPDIDVNKQGDGPGKRYTPLYCACTLRCNDRGAPPIRDLEIIRILLAHGADVHRVSGSGNTALHVCVYACRKTSDTAICAIGVAAAQILLKHGASPYATNAEGDMVFEYATGTPALETILRKYLAIDIRRFVLGTAEEYPRRARLRDLVPLIATYIV